MRVSFTHQFAANRLQAAIQGMHIVNESLRHSADVNGLQIAQWFAARDEVNEAEISCQEAGLDDTSAITQARGEVAPESSSSAEGVEYQGGTIPPEESDLVPAHLEPHSPPPAPAEEHFAINVEALPRARKFTEAWLESLGQVNQNNYPLFKVLLLAETEEREPMLVLRNIFDEAITMDLIDRARLIGDRYDLEMSIDRDGDIVLK